MLAKVKNASGRIGIFLIHFQVHYKVKPFHCSLCEMHFSRKSNLAVHVMRHEKRNMKKAQLAMDTKRHVPKQHRTRSQGRKVTRGSVSSSKDPQISTENVSTSQAPVPSMSQRIDNDSEIKVETPTGLYTVGQIKVEIPDYEDGHVEFKIELPSNLDSNMETEEHSYQAYDGNEVKCPSEIDSVGIKVEPQEYHEAEIKPFDETFDFCDIKKESLL